MIRKNWHQFQVHRESLLSLRMCLQTGWETHIYNMFQSFFVHTQRHCLACFRPLISLMATFSLSASVVIHSNPVTWPKTLISTYIFGTYCVPDAMQNPRNTKVKDTWFLHTRKLQIAVLNGVLSSNDHDFLPKAFFKMCTFLISSQTRLSRFHSQNSYFYVHICICSVSSYS